MLIHSVVSDSLWSHGLDCNPPGSSVHGIFQARIPNGLPFPSPRDFPNPGIELASSVLAGRFFTTEPPGKQDKSSFSVMRG